VEFGIGTHLTEKALKIKLGELEETPAYAEFVKSPEYREWVRSRK
jgi:hypothetical protein